MLTSECLVQKKQFNKHIKKHGEHRAASPSCCTYTLLIYFIIWCKRERIVIRCPCWSRFTFNYKNLCLYICRLHIPTDFFQNDSHWCWSLCHLYGWVPATLHMWHRLIAVKRFRSFQLVEERCCYLWLLRHSLVTIQRTAGERVLKKDGLKPDSGLRCLSVFTRTSQCFLIWRFHGYVLRLTVGGLHCQGRSCKHHKDTNSDLLS